MVGRQVKGRIDSRLEQATAGRNEGEENLGGLSCVCVGDPAQCEAIMDQQIYDVRSHKGTLEEGEKKSVQLLGNTLARKVLRR